MSWTVSKIFGGTVEQATALERRIAKIGTPDLAVWAHHALYGVGRALGDWERTHDDAALQEAEEGAVALLAVLREIRAR